MFNDHMSSWHTSIERVNSRCGFCDAHMTSWTEREKHLALHFKDGADMKDWQGDRGFDDEIDSIIQNDMPAFMIGAQRKTLAPFSATQADHCIDRSDIGVPHSAGSPTTLPTQITPGAEILRSPDQAGAQPFQGTHSYRLTERLLLIYVSEEIGHGRVPSDRQLQKKTSEIMFGPGDEWDQTWADNPQWLEMFRKEAGLISLPLSGGRNAFVGRDVISARQE